MKCVFVFLAIFGLAYGASIQPRASLREAVDAFGEVFPSEEFLEIVRRYRESSSEVQAVFGYLGEPNFHAVVAIVASNEDFLGFIDWVDERGFELGAWLDNLAEIYNWPISKDASVGQRTWSGFTDELFGLLLPLVDDLLAVSETLKASGGDYAVLLEKIHAFRPQIAAWRATPEFIQVADDLRDLGVNVDLIIEFVTELLGWN